MAVTGSTPRDGGNIPLSSVLVPGNATPVLLQGSTLSTTDGNSNISAPVNVNLAQIGTLATQMSGSDGVTASNVLLVVDALYNGSTVDQQRGNQDNISLVNASGATTTQTTADQTNYNARGVIIVLDMTSVGTGSVTLAVQGKDPVSGKYYTILTGAAVTTNSTNVYRVYPGLTASANAIANDVLPRTWRVVVTANNANATTYKVGAMMML